MGVPAGPNRRRAAAVPSSVTTVETSEHAAPALAPLLIAALFSSVLVGHGGHEGSGVSHWAYSAFAATLAVAVVVVARTLTDQDVPALAFVAALASAAAGAIHLVVAQPHFDEWWGFGVFFVVSGAVQMGWAALAATAPSRELLLIGAAGNAAIVVLWAVTRTTGLPFGPESGAAEAVGSADLAAMAFEVVLVAAAVLLLRGVRSLAAPRATAAALAAACFLATTAALAGESHHAGHGDDGHEHSGAHAQHVHG
jgi:hypothetical protein